MSTWLVTGCSAGLGRAFASAALEAGHRVVVTARDAATVEDLVARFPDRAQAVRLDVTDPLQVDDAVAAAEQRFGGVDVLVNNAGYGYRAAVEEGEDEAVRRLFETHVFGALRLMQAALPGMRARRSGTVVNVSSVGARVAPAGSGFYGAVKAALEALTFTLRREAGPLGVRAMVVEPGSFRTEFAGRSLTQSASPIGDYEATAGRRRIEHDRVDGTQPGDPVKAAAALLQAVESEDPPALLLLGSDAADMFPVTVQQLLDDAAAWDAVSRSTDY